MVSLVTTFFVVGFSFHAAAKNRGFYQQPRTDTVPEKIIQKVRITVKDLMDGAALDSVYVTAGMKKGFTDKNGYLQLDSLQAGTNLVITKAGYLAASKKAKADITIRLSKRDLQSST